MWSLRSRVLALVLGLLTLSLPLISYKSYRDARHETEELFDAQLAQSARLLEGLVGHNMSEESLGQVQIALDKAVNLRSRTKHPGALSHPYESKLAFQVFTDTGRLILRSASVPDSALDELLASQTPSYEPSIRTALSLKEQGLSGYHDAILEDGRLWRMFLLHDQQSDLWILAGEREDVRGELISKIARRTLIPDLVALPMLALMVWLAVGWGLRPLERMVQLLKVRDPNNLSPILFDPLPAELEPMAASLNRLLLQVTRLLEREKRFLADAAHELRTPLAVLRIHQQNALEARDPKDREEALQHLGNAVERATRVVSQLLTLARLEPNAVQPAMVKVDLLAVVRGQLAELTPLALDQGQDLILDANEDADYRMVADAPSLGILLQNLVSNAVQYTPAGGMIQVILEAEKSMLTLRVLDSGSGVPPELREKLFERFFRQGPGQGAGLGLSIVARVVELHGGNIELLDSMLDGLEVRVQLPRRF
ncbi:ATP-binding protein [Azomonas macrocytogenes]|uniref:histidine kinase n=1 Tax=Azomonas macrocytogenes TaxID=69962 RepID=A0A839T719_AZOMA|nr:ATP-binding protein [Azomonas macrocytogenes]MBB3104869.1 two-component system sensor histidine kinase QseC [Azomonas macrocytogenes]